MHKLCNEAILGLRLSAVHDGQIDDHVDQLDRQLRRSIVKALLATAVGGEENGSYEALKNRG